MIRNRRQRHTSSPRLTNRPRPFAERAIIVMLGASAPFAATAASFSTPADAATTPSFHITLSTHSLAFGNQAPGSATALSVNVQNTGRKAVSLVDRLLGSSEFSVSMGTCTAHWLAPGEACSYAVTFTPSGTGPAQGKLRVLTRQGTRAQTVSLTGAGVIQQMQTYNYRYTYSNPPEINGVAAPQSYDGVGYAPADTYVTGQTIPVYDSTGLTQVGSYLIGAVSDGPVTDALNTVGVTHYVWGNESFIAGTGLTSFFADNGLGSESGQVYVGGGLDQNSTFDNRHPAIFQRQF